MPFAFPSSEIALWTMAIGVAANLSSALVGCFLVLRRTSLLGDAISHAVLPGIVAGFLLTGVLGGWPALLGALVFGVLTSLLTQTLHELGRVPEDASMGVVFTSLFALGVVLITRFAAHVDLDPGCVLYGLLEFAPLDTVRLAGADVPRALLTLGPVLLLTVGFVAVLWKELKIASFDPGLATAMGFSARLIHYLLMCLVALVVVASFEAVGSILVVAMLIVPGATAHLLTDRLGWLLVWAAVVAVVSAIGGYLAAVALNTSAAGMMAVVAGAQFTLAVFVAPRHGLIARALRQLNLSMRIAGEDIVAQLYRQEEAAAEGRAPAPLSPSDRNALVTWLATRWLNSKGLVTPGRGRGVTLTDAGRAQARSVVRAHRLWESYLGQHFDLPLDHLHAPAERIEHFLGPMLQAELAAELEGPGRDPHGKEIP
ncbi:MAG: metal ABC transporter permease [Pirellulales bacterium]